MYKDIIDTELKQGHNLSIITLIQALIGFAYENEATDIHFFPNEKSIIIRLRIDGILYDKYDIPISFHSSIITRIKVLTGLRTDEHYIAQDGRLRHTVDALGTIDIRISIIPTYYGENAVLRLLRNQSLDLSLKYLGFDKKDEEKINSALQKNNGMILVTGPTGSGKTTTLYSCINILNNPQTSIITIEDPIEYAINGISQIQVNIKSGLSFDNGLRSILRQDPNIIMVGEIRDRQTASISINAALTGHLVLSTLHTTNATTSLPRLMDMGIESYLIASTVRIAIGQRLVRKICLQCKKERKLTSIEKMNLKEMFPNVFKKNTSTFIGNGCIHCNGSGYSGRTIINEILIVTKDIQDCISHKASSQEIQNIAEKNGMSTLIKNGIQKVEAGITTIEEIIHTIND